MEPRVLFSGSFTPRSLLLSASPGEGPALRRSLFLGFESEPTLVSRCGGGTVQASLRAHQYSEWLDGLSQRAAAIYSEAFIQWHPLFPATPSRPVWRCPRRPALALYVSDPSDTNPAHMATGFS